MTNYPSKQISIRFTARYSAVSKQSEVFRASDVRETRLADQTAPYSRQNKKNAVSSPRPSP